MRSVTFDLPPCLCGRSKVTLQFVRVRVEGESLANTQSIILLTLGARACAARVTVLGLCVCLSTTILGLQATGWLMSDTNIFSATKA